MWKDRDEGLSDRLVEGTVKFGGREFDVVGMYGMGWGWTCH